MFQYKHLAVPDFMARVAPPGYIAGLGRGAVGFTTRSDIGSARDDTHTEVVSDGDDDTNILARGRKRARGIDNDDEDNNHDDDDDDNNEVANDNGTTRDNGIDRDEDAAYAAVDNALRSRRRGDTSNRTRTQQGSRPPLTAQLADGKRALATVSAAEWASLPDVQDLVRRRGTTSAARQRRNNGLGDRLTAMRGDGDVRASTSALARAAATDGNGDDGSSTTVADLSQYAAARDRLLGQQLDRAAAAQRTSSIQSNAISIGTNANQMSSTLDIAITSTTIAEADVRGQRAQLAAIVAAQPRDSAAWLAAIQLEERAGQYAIARRISLEGAIACGHDATLWLNAVRLHSFAPGSTAAATARRVAARAVRAVPKSADVWLAAAQLAPPGSARAAVLLRAARSVDLDHAPQVWAAALAAAAGTSDVASDTFSSAPISTTLESSISSTSTKTTTTTTTGGMMAMQNVSTDTNETVLNVLRSACEHLGTLRGSASLWLARAAREPNRSEQQSSLNRARAAALATIDPIIRISSLAAAWTAAARLAAQDNVNAAHAVATRGVMSTLTSTISSSIIDAWLLAAIHSELGIAPEITVSGGLLSSLPSPTTKWAIKPCPIAAIAIVRAVISPQRFNVINNDNNGEDADDVTALLSRAENAIQEGAYQVAKTLLWCATQRHPNSVEVWIRRCAMLLLSRFNQKDVVGNNKEKDDVEEKEEEEEKDVHAAAVLRSALIRFPKCLALHSLLADAVTQYGSIALVAGGLALASSCNGISTRWDSATQNGILALCSAARVRGGIEVVAKLLQTHSIARGTHTSSTVAAVTIAVLRDVAIAATNSTMNTSDRSKRSMMATMNNVIDVIASQKVMPWMNDMDWNREQIPETGRIALETAADIARIATRRHTRNEQLWLLRAEIAALRASNTKQGLIDARIVLRAGVASIHESRGENGNKKMNDEEEEDDEEIAEENNKNSISSCGGGGGGGGGISLWVALAETELAIGSGARARAVLERMRGIGIGHCSAAQALIEVEGGSISRASTYSTRVTVGCGCSTLLWVVRVASVPRGERRAACAAVVRSAEGGGAMIESNAAIAVGRVLWLGGDDQRALSWLERAVKTAPYNADAWTWLLAVCAFGKDDDNTMDRYVWEMASVFADAGHEARFPLGKRLNDVTHMVDDGGLWLTSLLQIDIESSSHNVPSQTIKVNNDLGIIKINSDIIKANDHSKVNDDGTKVNDAIIMKKNDSKINDSKIKDVELEEEDKVVRTFVSIVRGAEEVVAGKATPKGSWSIGSGKVVVGDTDIAPTTGRRAKLRDTALRAIQALRTSHTHPHATHTQLDPLGPWTRSIVQHTRHTPLHLLLAKATAHAIAHHRFLLRAANLDVSQSLAPSTK